VYSVLCMVFFLFSCRCVVYWFARVLPIEICTYKADGSRPVCFLVECVRVVYSIFCFSFEYTTHTECMCIVYDILCLSCFRVDVLCIGSRGSFQTQQVRTKQMVYDTSFANSTCIVDDVLFFSCRVSMHCVLV